MDFFDNKVEEFITNASKKLVRKDLNEETREDHVRLKVSILFENLVFTYK